MSLQVWLPLNGDLHNQGLSNNISFTLASGNSLVSEGKTSDQSLKLTKLQPISTSLLAGKKELSFAYWVKVNTAWTANWLDGFRWTSTDGSTNQTSRQEFYTNCTRCGVWYAGSPNSVSGKVFTPGVWTHLAATINYNTGHAAFYINGQLSGSNNGVNTSHYLKGAFWLGDNGVDICENDVRIYDHCLSPKEVEEIARGLVLHYKLDELNNNLGATSANYSNQTHGSIIPANSWGGDSGTCTFYHYGGYNNLPYKVYHKTAIGSGGIYKKTANDIQLEANTTYTMSCWIKASRQFATSAYSFCINRGADNHYITYGSGFTVTSEWNFFTKTFTTASDENGLYGEMSIIYDDQVTDYYIYYSGFKIEKGNTATAWVTPSQNTREKIYDSSGYFNNAITVGNLISVIPSPRYNTATQFDGTSSYIEAESLPSETVTISAWVKFKTLPGSYKIILHDKFTKLAIGLTTTYRLITYVGSTNGGTGSQAQLPTLSTNTWYHIVVIKTGDTTRDVYFNGEQITNLGKNYWGGDLDKFTIGARHISGKYSNFFDGEISDVRVYTTALTSSQIKELYATSMSIDASGSDYARELVESYNSAGINKQGQAIFENFNESINQLAYIKKANSDNEQELNAYELYEY